MAITSALAGKSDAPYSSWHHCVKTTPHGQIRTRTNFFGGVGPAEAMKPLGHPCVVVSTAQPERKTQNSVSRLTVSRASRLPWAGATLGWQTTIGLPSASGTA